MTAITHKKDNTEGSLDCSIKVLKKRFKLSNEQRSALIDTLLGDGSLNKHGRCHRLHVKHSLKQISLVRYRRKMFANISSMPVRSFTQKVKNKIYEFCVLVTLSHPEFTRVHDWFFPGGKNTLLRFFLNNSIILFVLQIGLWTMALLKMLALPLTPIAFQKKEVELLSQTLNQNFNSATNLRQNKKKWIIYVPKKNCWAFCATNPTAYLARVYI